MAGSKRYISTTNPDTGASNQACGELETTSCEPQCLVQPSFFCGQLLTDEDLNELIAWAKGKFRLDRYKNGWGVVHGLSVRCADDKACGLVMAPGYAVDPCGNDIVVCEDIAVDLSAVCRATSGLCGDLPSEGYGHEDTANNPDDITVRAIDIYVHYAETPDVSLPALPTHACSTDVACEVSRTKEGASVVWREGRGDSDPLAEIADQWTHDYALALTVLQQFTAAFPELYGRGEDIKCWLLDWLERHPLHQFCFLNAELKAREPSRFEDELQVVETLFWIVQDYRNAFLSRPYRNYPAGLAVPVARVWIGREPGSNNDWRLIYVDNKPPFRRVFNPDTWPAPLGYINLAQLIWHRYDESCRFLRDKNVSFEDVVWNDFPASIHDLTLLLDCDPMVACAETIGLQILRRPGVAGEILGNRVFGFCGVVTPTEPPIPTVAPTTGPTTEPTTEPTEPTPTIRPTITPTVRPTVLPTVGPTVLPTIVPTIRPTILPTITPTIRPTITPTIRPTIGPTILPTLRPTISPTILPTVRPTISPTLRPTVELPGGGGIPPIVLNPADFPGRGVAEVNGIGPASTKRLESQNVGNLAQLASLQPTELATMLDISEVRAMGFIDEARQLLQKPRE